MLHQTKIAVWHQLFDDIVWQSELENQSFLLDYCENRTFLFIPLLSSKTLLKPEQTTTPDF
jgi:hypothetical protein